MPISHRLPQSIAYLSCEPDWRSLATLFGQHQRCCGVSTSISCFRILKSTSMVHKGLHTTRAKHERKQFANFAFFLSDLAICFRTKYEVCECSRIVLQWCPLISAGQAPVSRCSVISGSIFDPIIISVLPKQTSQRSMLGALYENFLNIERLRKLTGFLSSVFAFSNCLSFFAYHSLPIIFASFFIFILQMISTLTT